MDNNSKIASVTVIAFIALFVWVIITAGNDVEKLDKQEQEMQVLIQPSQTQYTTLRSWQPFDRNDTFGMDILITETDVTERKIKKLLRRITVNNEMALVRVFSSKEAWEDVQKGSEGIYGDVYERGYIAFYTKNSETQTNQIQWFQRSGALQHLQDTVTNL